MLYTSADVITQMQPVFTEMFLKVVDSESPDLEPLSQGIAAFMNTHPTLSPYQLLDQERLSKFLAEKGVFIEDSAWLDKMHSEGKLGEFLNNYGGKIDIPDKAAVEMLVG